MSRQNTKNISQKRINTKQALCMKVMGSNCHEVGDLLRLLSHPQRLMILGHLTQGPRTVSDLQKLTELSQSLLSQFLIRMKSEGLLASQRQGRFSYYEVSDKRVARLLLYMQNLFCNEEQPRRNA